MWKIPSSLLPSLLLLWPLRHAYAANFTFSYSAATQCGDFQVSWQGGVAPFQLTLVPSYGTPRVLSIPSTAFSSNHGTYSTTLPIPKGNQFMAVMSDSSGFASGGVSKVITVGAAASGNTCNTTDPGVDFTFDTPSALAQCRFDDYTAAVQPIVIKGIVPGGSSFVLNPPKGTLFDWTADIAAGTTVSFIMQDANGRQGGATEFLPVGLSDDSTCLDKNSPASVSNAPSLTVSRTATSTKPNQTSSRSSPSASSTNPMSTSNGGTIAAVIVGTIVALFVLGTLVWFYLRRRNGGTSVLKGNFFGRRFQKQEVDLMKGDSHLPPSNSLSPYPFYHPQDPSADISTPNSSSNLLGGGRPSDVASGFGAPPSLSFANPRTSAFSSQFPPSVHAGAVPDGSLYGGESAYGGGYAGSAFGHGAAATAAVAAAHPDGSVSSWDQSLTSSAARRKAAQAGVSSYQPPARFILHTDIEDDVPPPPEEEVIELPPQYTERRAPPRSLSPRAGGSGRSASSQVLAYLDDSHPS
ncbi:hypothetical protein GSI_06558 [Ganoderma sinense ZZ0214-1]|uniref:Transporter n=1 Tax=Ganoderma sinense ZZ0214-1 TaxID=1077348 RepID=A0A2G8SDJ5_9APHY|nr:hypothetical protein GSI_06558 [Ganoderma sinense ZZ0214-1]